jgi:predicted transcriptional regulator
MKTKNLAEVKSIMNPIIIKIIQELSVRKKPHTKEIAQRLVIFPKRLVRGNLSALMKSGVFKLYLKQSQRIMEKYMQ